MKRIGIDARLFSQTGVGVYIENLLYNLDKFTPSTWEIFVYVLRSDISKINFTNKNFRIREANYYWHKLGEQLGYLRLLVDDNLDLMHFTYLSYPIFYKKPFISTVHDLTHLFFKSGKASTKNVLTYQVKHHILKTVLSSQIKNSKAIITPTKVVKKQILEKYGIPYKNKIYPIYEGVNEKIKRINPNMSLENRFNKDFFIYIGNFYPHKNTERLIRAFSLVKKEVNLVLAGPDDYFAANIDELIKELNQQNRIFLYKNPDREDLVFFYKNARALINPSLAEGFGLTNVEAMFFGCPVIGSNIEVFKEILGEYISFDPYNIDDIAKKITEFSETVIKKDFKKILNQYSFERMTKQTIELYNKVLSS